MKDSLNQGEIHIKEESAVWSRFYISRGCGIAFIFFGGATLLRALAVGFISYANSQNCLYRWRSFAHPQTPARRSFKILEWGGNPP